MDALKDRRYMDRVRLPAAQLYYRAIDKHKLLNTYHGPLFISDISKSSLSIEGSLPLKTRTTLCLKILVPDHPEIILKGQILGFIRDRAGRVIRTVIQLLPYGYNAQYNTFRDKKRLEHCLNSRSDL